MPSAEPSVRQQQPLDALKLVLPRTVPAAHVTVGTRKQINQERKALGKQGWDQRFGVKNWGNFRSSAVRSCR